MPQYGKKKPAGKNTKKLEKKIKKGLTKHAALNEAAGAGTTPVRGRGTAGGPENNRGKKGRNYGY